MKLLRQLWNRLRGSTQARQPAIVGDQAARRERLLRDILQHAELALAYSEPCPECQARANRLHRWKAELEAELEAMNAIN